MTIRITPNEQNSSLIYSRHELLQLRKNVTKCESSKFYHEIKGTAQVILKHKPTRRKPKHHIPTLITSRPDTHLKYSCNEPNSKNLIQIELQKSSNKSCQITTSTSFCLLNCRSVRNKTLDLNEFIQTNKLDLFALSETWLTETNDQSTLAELIPSGYSIHSVPRKTRGGGVALIFKSTIKSTKPKPTKFKSFECLDSFVTIKQKTIRIIIIYRPPGKSVDLFFNEFKSFLEDVTFSNCDLLVVGDFNFHYDNSNDPSSLKLKCLLDTFLLRQHVQSKTHVRGHTLDLVISRLCESFVGNLTVQESILSDHFPIFINLKIQPTDFSVQTRQTRNLKNLNSKQFLSELDNTQFHNIVNLDNVDIKATHFNDILQSTFNKLYPVVLKHIRIRPKSEWFNDETLQAKRSRNKAERTWRNSKLQIHRELYQLEKLNFNRCVVGAKKSYYSDIIDNSDNKFKELFRISNALSDYNYGVTLLPESDTDQQLADKFSFYFLNKISTIRTNLALNSEDGISCNTNPTVLPPSLSSFSTVSEPELSKIITSCSSKSCSLDPIPTQFLKDCLPSLICVITNIINSSIRENIFPDTFKSAIIFPLIKKKSLDPEIEKNYRPVSNLSFISKLLERVISKQLTSHVRENNLLEPFQSAYRKFHSTETALVRVHNDILTALDNQNCILLILLDLSAAFDTVDHQILINRLETDFGITDNALKIIQSYITNRTQRVVVGQESSAECELKFGVPQGSVLGPILFSLYTSSLGSLVRKHGLEYHLYADDTQLYISFNPSNPDNFNISKIIIEQCIDSIKVWMSQNFLKLNDDKTEYLVIGSKFKLSKLDGDLSVRVGKSTISQSKSARNIGAIFDSNMNMECQINNICKTGYFHLRNIGKIKKYISIDATKSLIQALVISRLDNFNSLLSGVPKKSLDKLQKLQNSAARLITGSSKFNHITPILFNLHWLPIAYRIDYKILLLTFKCLNGLAPVYLSQLLNQYQPNRQLRSSSDNWLLCESNAKSSAGERSFAVKAPKLWNKLPLTVRSCESLQTFKSNLKTFFIY
ncbi:hypothetical protein SNE40_012018 [Patella caerulea]|uniref:Reverse transcriptase domain-containing protein n=1 Tax=Patella caerulea TaxID=87958 RepID=A0AAN8JKX5_PATCE